MFLLCFCFSVKNSIMRIEKHYLLPILLLVHKEKIIWLGFLCGLWNVRRQKDRQLMIRFIRDWHDHVRKTSWLQFVHCCASAARSKFCSMSTFLIFFRVCMTQKTSGGERVQFSSFHVDLLELFLFLHDQIIYFWWPISSLWILLLYFEVFFRLQLCMLPVQNVYTKFGRIYGMTKSIDR